MSEIKSNPEESDYARGYKAGRRDSLEGILRQLEKLTMAVNELQMYRQPDVADWEWDGGGGPRPASERERNIWSMGGGG